MRGKVNMSGVQEQGEFVLLPEGEYLFGITEVNEKTTANGDPCISIKLTVIGGQYKDTAWVWDNIVIPSLDSPSVKILGRTKHFLHCIGEPYDGEEVAWDSDNWLYKEVRAEIGHELPNSYHKYTKPVINRYILDEKVTKNAKDNEVPF